MTKIIEEQDRKDKNLYDNHHIKLYARKMENIDAEKLQELFINYVNETGKSVNSIAKELDIQQASLQRFFHKKQQSVSYDASLKLLTTLGYSVKKDEREATREVCFVDPKIVPAGSDGKPPIAEDYLAVPLVGEVGAGPGIMPSEEIDGWVLVYREHQSVSRRSNMLAVEVGMNQRSMVPTLHPKDIILVDRDDWGQFSGYQPPGNIFLVREPGQEGGGKVKRVSLSGKGDLATITFYSDNSTEYGPEVFHMSQYDNDLRSAIVGRVVWAWADLSRK